MQKMLFFILFAFAGLSLSAQNIRFTDNSNVWFEKGIISGDDFISTYYTLYYNGDTVVNGQTYKKIYNDMLLESFGATVRYYNRALAACVREDTTTGIVYLVWNKAEIELYNYNRQVNDSFALNSSIHKVTGISQVTINNVVHRVWEYKIYSVLAPEPFPGDHYYVVEGIGSLSGSNLGILHPVEDESFLQHSRLFCFRNNGAPPSFDQSVDSFNNAGCALAVGTVEENVKQVLVIPNPANSSAYILFSSAINKGDIFLYDVAGRLLVKQPLNGDTRFSIGNSLPATGIYFYRVVDNTSNKVYTGRFQYLN